MRKEYLDKFINIKTEICTTINNVKKWLFSLEKWIIKKHFSDILDRLKNLIKWNLNSKENNKENSTGNSTENNKESNKENNTENNTKNNKESNKENIEWFYSQLSDLTPEENKEMMNLVKESKTPKNPPTDRICYLENTTYKKYLNIIERDLNLPKYTLECVCNVESLWWYLYSKNWNILWSHKWAQGLFQFIPSTANQYMKHNKLKEKYWKTFTSRNEFLKDPLASAWAAWIMYSELMHKHNYNLQTSLVCYNRWIWRYQKHIWKRNLRPWDLEHLPKETRNYVKKITNDLLRHNWASCNNVLLADLWQYSRNNRSESIDWVFTA